MAIRGLFNVEPWSRGAVGLVPGYPFQSFHDGEDKHS